MKQNEILSAICSALVGIGAGLALLVVGALIACRSADPDPLLTAVSYIALVLGAALCGLLQGRRGASPLGILLSAALFALFPLTISLVFGGTEGLLTRSLIYLLMGVISGGIAWLIPQKRRPRRYRY